MQLRQYTSLKLGDIVHTEDGAPYVFMGWRSKTTKASWKMKSWTQNNMARFEPATHVRGEKHRACELSNYHTAAKKFPDIDKYLLAP